MMTRVRSRAMNVGCSAQVKRTRDEADSDSDIDSPAGKVSRPSPDEQRAEQMEVIAFVEDYMSNRPVRG